MVCLAKKNFTQIDNTDTWETNRCSFLSFKMTHRISNKPIQNLRHNIKLEYKRILILKSQLYILFKKKGIDKYIL